MSSKFRGLKGTYVYIWVGPYLMGVYLIIPIHTVKANWKGGLILVGFLIEALFYFTLTSNWLFWVTPYMDMRQCPLIQMCSTNAQRMKIQKSCLVLN